jgi:hypothetical protein
MHLLCAWLHILQTTIFNFWGFIPIIMLFYDSTVNFNQNYIIFNLWSDLDTFKLHLYSCPHQPDDNHKSGQNMLVTAIKLHPWNQNTFVGLLMCCMHLVNVQNMKQTDFCNPSYICDFSMYHLCKIKTLHIFANASYLCLYDSGNKQLLFSPTALSGWS